MPRKYPDRLAQSRNENLSSLIFGQGNLLMAARLIFFVGAEEIELVSYKTDLDEAIYSISCPSYQLVRKPHH